MRWLPLVLSLVVALPALAGETDQHYTWRRRLPDSAPTYNAFVNDHFAGELRGLNRLPWASALQCRDVAHAMADGLFWKEYRFFIRTALIDGLIWAPYSNAERSDEYRRYGLYRHAPPWSPAFSIIPLDTTVRFGDVYLGTDKIAHFFPNGWRYYVRYHEALDAGRTPDEAFEEVLQYGVEQEAGIFGMDFGTFSYSDLEANWAGLRWYFALCDDEDPLLLWDDDTSAWRLREPFDIVEWINPCWDESFYGNVYTDDVWPFVKKGFLEYCALRRFPEVEMRFERYREMGCDSRTIDRLDELIASGELPDPRPYSVEGVCTEAGSAAP